MPRARSRLSRRSATTTTVTGEGIVLTGARAESAVRWAKRGLGALHVVRLGDWTLVAPGGRPKARYPYDDAVRTLAGRTVSYGMRPALGFFRVGKQAVITHHPRRRFAQTRWIVWTPRDGVVHPRGLPAATVEDIVAAAGQDPESPEISGVVEEILADVGAGAHEVLSALLAVLDLPGTDVLTGRTSAADLPEARLVVPADRYARAFDRIVRERSETDGDTDTYTDTGALPDTSRREREGR